MIDSNGLTAVLQDHALKQGLFEAVNGHEPLHPPGKGLTYSVWVDLIRPVAQMSGLAATSARVVCLGRIYSNMAQKPMDGIDPSLLHATDVLMSAYNGDFELSGLATAIDLLGAYGDPLHAQAGYLEIDTVTFRVMTLTIPIIVADAWEQAA